VENSILFFGGWQCVNLNIKHFQLLDPFSFSNAQYVSKTKKQINRKRVVEIIAG
jgi:hypothetical protein